VVLESVSVSFSILGLVLASVLFRGVISNI
jgi:hypothetical protein